MKLYALHSKIFVVLVALLAWSGAASLSFGQPVLTVIDNGLNASSNREWLVQVAPDASLFTGGQGSLATELAFEVTTGTLVSATSSSLFPFNNPGNDPFTGGFTFGVDANIADGTVFSALGSNLFTSGAPVSVLTIETAGAGATTLTWGGQTLLAGTPNQFVGSRIAQDGTNFDGFMGSISSAAGLICDADADGDCDQADINLLYDAFGTNGPLDLDGSNVIDAGDIEPWLAAASDVANPAKANASDIYTIGDADLDGDVDSTDLGLLLNNFGDNNRAPWLSGNLDGDAFVGSTDLGLLLNNFSFTSTASAAAVAAVPEPGCLSLLLVALAGMGLGSFRRKR